MPPFPNITSFELLDLEHTPHRTLATVAEHKLDGVSENNLAIFVRDPERNQTPRNEAEIVTTEIERGPK